MAQESAGVDDNGVWNLRDVGGTMRDAGWAPLAIGIARFAYFAMFALCHHSSCHELQLETIINKRNANKQECANRAPSVLHKHGNRDVH